MATRQRILWITPVLAVAAVLSCGELADPDIWWNAAAGAWWWRHGTAPPLTLYGVHGCPDALPVDGPLAHIAIGAFVSAFGVKGLLLLRFLGVAVAGAAVFGSCARRVAAPWAALAASLALCAVSPRLSVRGELFTLVLLPLTLELALGLIDDLRRDQEASRWALGTRPVALFVIGVLWPHLHGAFPLGVLALAAMCLGVVAERARRNLAPDATARAAIALVALVGGIATAPHALGVFADGATEREIARTLGFREWEATLPALWRGGARPSTVALIALAGSWVAALASWRRGGALPRLLAPLPIIAVALDIVRGAAMPVLCCGAWLRLTPTSARPVVRRGAALAGCAIVAATVVVQVGENPPFAGLVDSARLVPVRLTAIHAARTLKAHDVRGRLFAPLHLSNWFVFTAADRIEVLWCGRRTYSPQCLHILRDGIEQARQGFDEARARFAFDLVLLEFTRNDELLRAVAERHWRLLHLDLRYAVFAAPERTELPDFTVPTVEALLAQEGLEVGAPNATPLLERACERLAFLGRAEDAARLCASAVER